MQKNHWLNQQQFEEFLEAQYQDWYAQIEFLKHQHAQELDNQKDYLCDKIDEYLKHKAAEFYAACATKDEAQLAHVAQDVKAQVIKYL